MKTKYPKHKYSEADANKGLARYIRLDNPESYPFDNLHTHEFNEILVFLKGGGVHNINFHEHIIRDNSIHLLAANDLHLVERGMDSQGFAIVYKEQFLFKLQEFTKRDGLAEIFSESRVINLTDNETKDFQFLFRELMNNNQNSLYTLSLIGAFLSKIAHTFENTIHIPHNSDPIVQEVFQLINKHYHEHKSLQFYADKLNIPLRTLTRKIKDASGNNVRTFLQDKILKEAKRKIIQAGDNLHIGDIANELGFSDTAHFTNWFKRKTGISPSQFKT